MPAHADLTDLSHCCDLLSDPIRLRIVLHLAKGESNVLGISKEIHLRQPTTSYHLGLLRMNRLIVGKRIGTEVLYSLLPHAKASRGKVKISLPPYSLTVEKK